MTAHSKLANMLLVVGNSLLPGSFGFDAITVGHTVFVRRSRLYDYPLLAHEYIHTLQEEAGGFFTAATYSWRQFAAQEGSGPRNRNEAIGYLWEGWLASFRAYHEKDPWCFYRPLSGGTPKSCR